MAKINSFKKATAQSSEDLVRLFNLLQANIEKALTPVMRTPILDGVLLENVNLVSGAVNKVEHKLGRKVRGYLIVSNSTPASIYDYLNNTAYDSQRDVYLSLSTSASCTVNLWVF